MGAEKGFTTELKLLISVCGIYSTYLLYGVFQEGIYKFADKDGKQCVHGTIPKLVVACPWRAWRAACSAHTVACLRQTALTMWPDPTQSGALIQFAAL
jgi:hypothetical protein